MKKLYSLFLVVTLIFTFIPNALALEKWVHFDSLEEMENTAVKFNINGDEITSTKLETESIDNSNLMVKVLQPIDGGETKEIYRGPMSGLKDGPWQYVDYSKVSVFAVLIELKDSLEVLYIIPLEEEQNEIQSSKMETNTQNVRTALITPSDIEYEISYEIIQEDVTTKLVSEFNITSLSQISSEPVIIAGLYKNGMLEGVVNKKITLQAGATIADMLEIELPEENIDNYSVKLMIWESFSTLLPLGEILTVSNLSAYENIQPMDISVADNPQLYAALKKSRPMLDTDNDGIITVTELSELTGCIDLSHRNIESINGLQGLCNVTEIYICDNKIENADFLAPLTKLKKLNLRNNNISSLKAVPKNINSLHLENNLVTNLNVLKNCNQLISLFVDNNNIENLNFAVNMEKLQTLSAANNQINDISGISANTALKYINISDNNVSDISPLSNKTLLEDIRFSNNNVSDISSLPQKRFRNAYINGNNLTTTQKNSINAIVKKS